MTIEERAKAYADSLLCTCDRYPAKTVKLYSQLGYVNGATEQKAIDDRYYSEVLEVTLLEKETIYDKILESQRKALIDKAVIWIDENVGTFTAIAFRKYMEE